MPKKIPRYDRIRSVSGFLKFHLDRYPGSHKFHKRTLAMYGDTLESFSFVRRDGVAYVFRNVRDQNVWYMTPYGAINPIHNDHPDFISIYSSHYADQ